MLQKDIYPYISTNGTCISEVTLSRLKQAGLETIQFSLDTGKPDLYDKMMGVSGYFEKVLNTIKFAKSAGYIVNVKGVVTRLNAQTIGNLFDICADLGVDFVSVEAFSPGLHGRGNRDLLLTHKLAMKVKSLIEKASRLYSNRMLVAPFTVPKKWTGPADIIYCGGMYTAFVVQPDGSVCACEQVNDVSMNFGNIRDNPLTKIWASTRVLEFLNPDQSKVAEPCKSCKHFRRCRSGCFNYSLMYSDELYSPDPRCWKIKMGRDNPLKLEA
jgi:pyrroloquinoline quinone biosynthesis protein E